MPPLSFAAALAFINMLQQAWNAGAPVVASVVNAIKGALASHGIEADTAQLDVVIAEAQAAKAAEDARSGSLPPAA